MLDAGCWMLDAGISFYSLQENAFKNFSQSRLEARME
jgi:hypothetical protein